MIRVRKYFDDHRPEDPALFSSQIHEVDGTHSVTVMIPNCHGLDESETVGRALLEDMTGLSRVVFGKDFPAGNLRAACLGEDGGDGWMVALAVENIQTEKEAVKLAVYIDEYAKFLGAKPYA